MMVVVAVVAILLAIGGYQITRSRRRVALERALIDLQGRIERAQSLAAVAGSRLGVLRDTTRPRLVYDGTCTADPGNQLWIRVTPPTVEIPSQLIYNQATDQVRVVCETFDLSTVTRTTGVFNEPSAPLTVFAFAPSGRLLLPPPAAPAPVYIEMGDPSDAQTHGLRILPSGVMCPASALGGPLCDEDLGP